MKKLNLSFIVIGLITSMIITFSCAKTEETPPVSNSVPANFKVDIPSSINSSTGKSISGIETDTIKGNVIYKNLRTFINVGSSAADMVNAIMQAIATNHLSQSITIDYNGAEDHKPKHLVVEENMALNGVTWRFKLTVTDVTASQKALQVYWNTNPVKGIAIVCPYYWNTTVSNNYTTTRYKVEYTEEPGTYSQQMLVSIVNYPLIPNDIRSINNLKLFAGKRTGSTMLDIYGNSNHPAYYIAKTDTIGRDYSFIAHADNALNIGVAQVGLTMTTTPTTGSVFTYYSVKNVLERELNYAFQSPPLTTTQLNSLLAQAEAPAFFKSGTGYVSCGANVPTDPGFTAAFRDLSGLTPFKSLDVKNMTIDFY